MLDFARRTRLPMLAAVLLAAVGAPAVAAADEPPTTAAPIAKADPVSVEIAASIGATARYDGAASYDVTSRGGALLGGSVWIFPSPRFALGLAYEHVGLGQEHADLQPGGSIDVARDLHALWLEVQMYMLRTDSFGLFLTIGPGLGVEHASAGGLVPQLDLAAPTRPFQCSGTAAPSFALRAGIGGELKLASNAYARLAFTADGHRLSTDPIDDCIGGAGSATVLTSSLSFGYRFDVSRYAR